jgi:NAD(P)H dehydrogenase (quinone)
VNITVILGHPDVNSFNYAIYEKVLETLSSNNHEVHAHDLYSEKFDPLVTASEISNDTLVPEMIVRYCSEVSAADGIIIIHPNWWGQPPAILKGWVDRVLRPGIAYRFLEGDKGEGIPVGLLKAHTALIFTTSNTPPERERKVFGDPLQTLWENCIFKFCGVKTVHRKNFGVIVTSTGEQRKSWLKEVADTVMKYFPKRIE